MIEGIKIDMTTDELRKHVEERAAFHGKKADWYASRAADLQGGIAEHGNLSNHSNDPVSSLVNSSKTHQERATFFKVIADHLVPDETYRLSQQDLAQLELFSRYF